MRVIYYTFTPFLDCAIEFINALKSHVELHVIIEVAPENKTSNIVDIANLPAKGGISPLPTLLDTDSYDSIKGYFEGTASVHFMAYTHKRSFSFRTLSESRKLKKYIREINPDVIHFEGFSQRSLGILPFLGKDNRLLFTVHDPLPHSGERNWRLALAKFFFMKVADGFFFYSDYARQQFTDYFKSNRTPKYLLNLFPYHYYKSYRTTQPEAGSYILFFGRLSPYKGIDTLINALPEFFKKHPDEKVIIAGKSIEGYALDYKKLAPFKKNVEVLDSYISNKDLASLISHAKLVVCPYKDATQSGVLMTSYAFNTPVIASSVGAFPEYIEDGVTGQLFPPNDDKLLAKALDESVTNGKYIGYRENLATRYEQLGWGFNLSTVGKAYTGSAHLSSFELEGAKAEKIQQAYIMQKSPDA